MIATARQLNRATLARQLLLQRQPTNVVDAVRRIVAVQAQEPASPYVALWNRISGFRPSDLDLAFANHAVVKATLMRITLHAVAADDHRALHEAMQETLRAARLHDRRFKSTGLSIAEADELVPHVLAFASEPRANADVEVWLADRLGVLPKPGVWWALRSFAPLIHAPTGGPWSFGRRPAYMAAPTPPADPRQGGAMQHLVRRYLEGFGPATAQDVAQFALLRQPAVRGALAAMDDELDRLEGPDGVTLYDLPGAPRPAEDTPAPARLMAMWDSVLLAYADRSRVIPPEQRQLVVRRNGDVLPTVLVDGYVSGVWRPTDAGIEITAFRPLPEEAWRDLATEARGLLALLADRDPGVYRRSGHWWSKLPPGEVQVLGT
ncbi:MAG: winged helix DNA-binding domain-containing protein [Ilumatobacteraceae bacterium]